MRLGNYTFIQYFYTYLLVRLLLLFPVYPFVRLADVATVSSQVAATLSTDY